MDKNIRLLIQFANLLADEARKISLFYFKKNFLKQIKYIHCRFYYIDYISENLENNYLIIFLIYLFLLITFYSFSLPGSPILSITSGFLQGLLQGFLQGSGLLLIPD